MRAIGRLVTISLCVAWLTAAAGAGETAPANDVTKAEHFLAKFEQHVRRAGGKPFPLTYDDKEAVRRVRALKEAYPDDPAVEALFQRTKAALMASKGDLIEITEEMLAYREHEKLLVQQLAALNVEAWKKYRNELAASGELIEKGLPAPDPLHTDPDETIGKTVILEDFRYPDNEFLDVGGQYVFVGSRTQGFYYVELSNRWWLGVYEALKRYRRGVSLDLPTPWTLVGKITGVTMLVPQAGEEKTMAPWFGWLVEPRALWVEGKLLTLADLELDLAGTFHGEDRLEQMKAAFYTYKAVPEDVEPIELVRILAAAAKEKNWPLFLECIDPARRATPTAIQRVRYFYDNNLDRYRRFYVHVDPYEVASVEAIRGWRIEEGSDEDFFLDDEQKERLREHSEPLVEQAIVMIRTYDEHGKQSAFPKKVVLRRYEGGRWYVYSGYPL